MQVFSFFVSIHHSIIQRSGSIHHWRNPTPLLLYSPTPYPSASSGRLVAPCRRALPLALWSLTVLVSYFCAFSSSNRTAIARQSSGNRAAMTRKRHGSPTPIRKADTSLTLYCTHSNGGVVLCCERLRAVIQHVTPDYSKATCVLEKAEFLFVYLCFLYKDLHIYYFCFLVFKIVLY